MQVIENWADVTGELVGLRPHPQLKDYASATLKLSDVKPVAGFANLFESAKGQTIEVNVPATHVPQIQNLQGSSVSWRVRKAGPTSNFAHPELSA